MDRPYTNLSIIEAVETLSNIADLDFDREIGIAQQHEVMLHHEKIAYKTVHWLHRQDVNETVNLVRETFRVILQYLRHFYKKEYGHISDQKTLEGIKTIMVLVGEAAKKLDKYTQLFHKVQGLSVTDLREYKQLQDFYLTKIAKKIEDGSLGKWVLSLPFEQQAQEGEVEVKARPVDKMEKGKRVFIDLESVKKDVEYELFFIRKENGSHFFSPRLLRNIKLVCDFGGYFGEHKEADPLASLLIWQDRVLQICAKNILRILGTRLDYFFQKLRNVKEQELAGLLSKALMALLLSSYSHNLLRNEPVKCCADYFFDFQVFLREALLTAAYQRFLAYSPDSSNKDALDLLELVQTTCRALYINLQGMSEMISVVHKLVQEASLLQSPEHAREAEKSGMLWNKLAGQYVAMNKLLKRHPNGPLLKVLDLLEKDAYHVWDPLKQHNIPNHLFDLYFNERRVAHVRFAAPVYQEFIHKAVVGEEFKEFLRSYQDAAIKRKHLLINVQDRTSWKEHARCAVLEELQHLPQFKEALTVVTLPFDTDFYQQLAPYHQTNQAHLFMDQFKEHLMSDYAGFYFPPHIKKILSAEFFDGALEAVHRIFFSSRNVLSREHRLNFIEIFYLFLKLKLIEIVQCDSFNICSKDSLDVSQASSVELFIFLKILNQMHLTTQDVEIVNFMIYGPTLLIRERNLLLERFHRMIGAIRTMENAQHEFGAENFVKIVQEGFILLFKTPILQSFVLSPK